MKKLISKLLVLTLLSSLLCFPAQIANAADAITLPSGFAFADICYSVELSTYVAMAKNATTSRAKIFTSKDLTTWAETFSPDVSSLNSALSGTTQIIEWWSQQNIFVALIGSKLYVSPTGYSWTEYTNLGISNPILEINAGKLVIAGGSIVRVFSSLSNPIVADNYTEFSVTASNYVRALGVSNTEPVRYQMIDQWTTWSKTGDGNVTTVNPNLGSQPAGVSYISKYDKWVVVNNTATLRLLTTPASYTAVDSMKLTGDATNSSNLTAVSVNDNDIIVGTADGKIYSTEHTSTPFTADTVWNVAQATPETAAITDKVVAMCPTSASKFVAVTTSKVYTVSKTTSGYTYEDINNILTISRVQLVKSMFTDVALTSIAYSPRLDLYVAVGKDNTQAANAKGRIYTSVDGTIWERTNGSLVVDLDQTPGQGLIWWDEARCFIIRAGKDIVYSKNGYNWTFGQDKFYADSARASGGAFSVAGGKLYEATFGGRKINVYTCTNAETFPALDSYSVVTYYPYSVGTGTSILYVDRVASDGAATPTVMGTYTYIAAIYGPNVTGYTDPTVDWKRITNTQGIGPVTDLIYSSNQQKFIMTKSGTTTAVVFAAKDGTISAAPVNSGFNAANTRPLTLATNNTNLVIGTEAGEIYVAPDATGFTSWTKVPSINSTPNALKVQAVCVGKNGDFYAVASAVSTNGSDILRIKADGSSYEKISEKTNFTGLGANSQFNVLVDTTYRGAVSKDMEVIAAVFNSEDKLMQITIQMGTVSSSNSKILIPFTTNENVTSDCYMKVMLWNSLNDMQPMAGANSFFK